MDTFFEHLSQFDLIAIAISLVLAVATKPIIHWLNHGSNDNNSQTRIFIMRVLNILIILAIILKTVFTSTFESTWLVRIVQVLITIYFAVLTTQIAYYFLLKRFGRARSTDQMGFADTYSSRALGLFFGVFIAIIAAIIVLKIIGLDSWLETGGVLGIIGIFLAMTQSSWAPDLVAGLIILNSKRCDEGDIVQIFDHDKTIVAQVFKTKFFHTELLDLANNHRLMVRNVALRDMILHNLSRFASAKGLRECLCFNIGYEHLEKDVTAMFLRAFEKFDSEHELREEQFAPEVRVLETGDYAVQWGVFYYIKDVKNILLTRQAIRSCILAESLNSDISLATPVLQDINAAINKADLTNAKPA